LCSDSVVLVMTGGQLVAPEARVVRDSAKERGSPRLLRTMVRP
jgi:hypothetical protein